MDAVALLREQIANAHAWLHGTLGEITSEQANWQPGGKAHAVGATYAHLTLSEDWIINGLLRGVAPLFMSIWAGRSGMSDLPPTDDVTAREHWSRRVIVDIGALRAYAAEVHTATDRYLGGLISIDLEHPIDLSPFGIAERSLGWTLSVTILNHVGAHTGEIACVKGLQGLQGYPL